MLPAGPKCKAGLFPDVRGRVARPGVSQSPRRDRRCYLRARRAALTMEHGLREVDVVMMIGTAAGASSHHP